MVVDSLSGQYMAALHPWYEPFSLPKPSRGTYHGANGRQLKVTYPGHTDLVWATNFNDEYAPFLACDRQSYWWKRLPEDLRPVLSKSFGIHPEFIFSKAIDKVTVTVLEATKFSHMEPGGDDFMKKRKVLWNATFSLLGGNHITPTMSAPPFTKMCDAPPHHVWNGGNIGKWNEDHVEPSLFSFFDVKLDGYTMDGNDFHEDMKVMLDRRHNSQGVMDFQPADIIRQKQQNLYMKTGPALALAKAQNFVTGMTGAARELKQNTMGI